MRTREWLMALFVVVVAVAGCKPDKGPPPPPRENPFVILSDGQLYVGVISKDGKRFYIKPQVIWQCDDGGGNCKQQALSCPTCSVCDCRQPQCSKWCMQPPPVIETAVPVPVPGGDPGPAPQPTPTAPK